MDSRTASIAPKRPHSEVDPGSMTHGNRDGKPPRKKRVRKPRITAKPIAEVVSIDPSSRQSSMDDMRDADDMSISSGSGENYAIDIREGDEMSEHYKAYKNPLDMSLVAMLNQLPTLKSPEKPSRLPVRENIVYVKRLSQRMDSVSVAIWLANG